MIDHIGLSVSDFVATKRFYDQTLAPLGMTLLAMLPEDFTDGVKVGGYGAERPIFWLGEGAAQVPPLHVAFSVDSRTESRCRPCGRGPGQRRAGPAPALSLGVLRGLRVVPGWQQHRGRLSQALGLVGCAVQPEPAGKGQIAAMGFQA